MTIEADDPKYLPSPENPLKKNVFVICYDETKKGALGGFYLTAEVCWREVVFDPRATGTGKLIEK